MIKVKAWVEREDNEWRLELIATRASIRLNRQYVYHHLFTLIQHEDVEETA